MCSMNLNNQNVYNELQADIQWLDTIKRQIFKYLQYKADDFPNPKNAPQSTHLLIAVPGISMNTST